MAIAERTLVKSAPELWRVLDDPDRMQRWLAELTELEEAGPVTVVARESERRLAWRRGASGPAIEVTLEEKGWGTHVRLRSDAEAIPDGMFERALDELGTAQKRPFSRPT